MKKKILDKLSEKMQKDMAKGFLKRSGCFDLYMKKFILDEQFEDDEFEGDVLNIVYPNSFSNCFKVIPYFPKNHESIQLRFGSMEEVADWIAKTYC